MEKPKSVKRRSTRFSPDPGTIAELSYHPISQKFQAQNTGIVLTESAHGCSIVHAGAPLKVGDEITIKVGLLAPIAAIVRWVVPLDEKIQKAGFEYEG